MLVIPLSLVIIFLLLFVTFQRVRQALLVILNVPFALVGGVAALWIRDLNLNLSASVGFIALFGVAVLNGVVMIAAINRLREEAGLDLRESVLRGATTRLKPVMMTALVAALGFVPMALSHGAGAEVGRPLASVVIGGITTSTLLTLIVLPTLYQIVELRALRQPGRGLSSRRRRGGCPARTAGVCSPPWHSGSRGPPSSRPPATSRRGSRSSSAA